MNRVLGDDRSKGDMNHRKTESLKELEMSLGDFDMWPIYIIRFFGYLQTVPVSGYLTLTLRHFPSTPIY